MDTFVGTYSYDYSDNMDDYLRALGVGLVLRKVLSVARPTYRISYNTDTTQWTIVTESEFKKKEITFRLSEKFHDETFDGRPCQTTVQLLENGRSMIWQQACEEGPDVSVAVTLIENGLTLKQSLRAGELTCALLFRRNLPEPLPAQPTVADGPAIEDEGDY